MAKTEWAEQAAWWGRWPEWQELRHVDQKPRTGFEKMNATIWLNTFCWGGGGRPESPRSLWKGYEADEKLAGWFSCVIIKKKRFNFFQSQKLPRSRKVWKEPGPEKLPEKNSVENTNNRKVLKALTLHVRSWGKVCKLVKGNVCPHAWRPKN